MMPAYPSSNSGHRIADAWDGTSAAATDDLFFRGNLIADELEGDLRSRRQRQGGIQADRETLRQRDIETERQIDRETERQIDRETERQGDRATGGLETSKRQSRGRWWSDVW
eukprot:52085-Rhodomonas_salina.5